VSAIVGVWRRDGGPAPSADLERMLAACPRNTRGSTWSWDDGPFAVAGVGASSRANDDDCVAAVCGAVYAAGEGRGALLRKDESDAQIILDRYRSFADEFLRGVRGSFTAAVHDRSRHTLLLARDWFGHRPIYYAIVGGAVYFSSYIRPLLTVVPFLRPNEEAIADLLLWGSTSSPEQTFFDGILAVPPGRMVEFTAAGVSVHAAQDVDRFRTIRCNDDYEAAELLRDAVLEAVRRTIARASAVAVSVSGGLDSSAIYCGVRDLRQRGLAGAQLRGYTFHFPGDHLADEMAYLRLLEEGGNTIRRITAHPGWLESASLATWSSEAPVLFAQLNSEYRLLRAAAEDGCDALLDGGFGDQAVGNHAYWLDLLFSFRWKRLLRDMREQPLWQDDTTLKDWIDPLQPSLQRLLIPEFLLPVARRIRHMADADDSPKWYSSRLRRLAQERACSQPSPRIAANSHHAVDLYRMSHQRYYLHLWETALKRAAEFGIELGHPFTDPDLLQLLMALPGDQVSVGGVFRGLFREAMRGILPEPIRLRRSKADFLPAVRNAARKELQTFEFGRNMAVVEMGMVELGALRRDLPRMLRLINDRNDICAPREVMNLLALEIWLRVYFRGERPQAASVAPDLVAQPA